MNTLAPVSLATNNYVSSAPTRSSGKQEAAVETPGEEVSISDAARAKPSSGKGLGMMGKAAAVLALAGLLSGCAITTGGFDHYGGYRTETVGVTPNGTVYTQQNRTTPWGNQSQTQVIGPNGIYYQQNQQPYYYPQPHHHHHRQNCTPMSWWGPGNCY
jgi:hypothetical protein